MLNVFRENMKNFDFSRCATNFHFRSVLVDVLSLASSLSALWSFSSVYTPRPLLSLLWWVNWNVKLSHISSPVSAVTWISLGNFFQENKIKSLKIFLNLDNYEQNRRGKGSRLIISATPSLQTFPQARHKSSCGRRNARAVGPIMIEGLLACSCSKDTIAQV